MNEKISLCLTDSSGNILELSEQNSQLRLQSKLDVLIAEQFTRINSRLQSISDDEIRTAGKFNLAFFLKKYLEEMKDYV